MTKYENALKNEDGTLKNVMPKVAGSFFYCSCGCNVFHHPDKEDLDLYQCNSCGTQYSAK